MIGPQYLTLSNFNQCANRDDIGYYKMVLVDNLFSW